MNNIVHLQFDQKLDEHFPFPSDTKFFDIEIGWQVSCGLDCFSLNYGHHPTIKEVLNDLIDSFYAHGTDPGFAFKHLHLHHCNSVCYYKLTKPTIDHCLSICAKRKADCKHKKIETRRFGYSCIHCRSFFDHNKYTFDNINGIRLIPVKNTQPILNQ